MSLETQYIILVQSADDVFAAFELCFEDWQTKLRDADQSGVYGLMVNRDIYTLYIYDVEMFEGESQYETIFSIFNADDTFEMGFNLGWDLIYEFVQLINYRFGYDWKFEHYAT